jgi:hypothetical protein
LPLKKLAIPKDRQAAVKRAKAIHRRDGAWSEQAENWSSTGHGEKTRVLLRLFSHQQTLFQHLPWKTRRRNEGIKLLDAVFFVVKIGVSEGRHADGENLQGRI